MKLALIAKDPCVMIDTGKPTLTVGKEYTPTHIYQKGFSIIDDNGDAHSFGFKGNKYFEPEELSVYEKRSKKC